VCISNTVNFLALISLFKLQHTFQRHDVVIIVLKAPIKFELTVVQLCCTRNVWWCSRPTFVRSQVRALWPRLEPTARYLVFPRLLLYDRRDQPACQHQARTPAFRWCRALRSLHREQAGQERIRSMSVNLVHSRQFSLHLRTVRQGRVRTPEFRGPKSPCLERADQKLALTTSINLSLWLHRRMVLALRQGRQGLVWFRRQVWTPGCRVPMSPCLERAN